MQFDTHVPQVPEALTTILPVYACSALQHDLLCLFPGGRPSGGVRRAGGSFLHICRPKSPWQSIVFILRAIKN